MLRKHFYAVLLSVIMLSVVRLNVIMPSVVRLNVMAPKRGGKRFVGWALIYPAHPLFT